MKAKEKKKFLIHCNAEFESEGYDKEDAINNLLSKKTITPKRQVVALDKMDYFAESFIRNIPGIIKLIAGLFYFFAMYSALRVISEFPQQEFVVIGTISWIILFLKTMNFPNWVNRYLRKSMRTIDSYEEVF